MRFKYFKVDGKLYRMKPQYGFSVLLVVGLLAVGYGAYWVEMYPMTWIMLILAILTIVALSRKKLTIDMAKREVHAQAGIGKPLVVIPVDRVQHFELYTVSNNFIRTNAMLSAYYLDNNGKEKSIQIAQGFTVRTMQNILNELEEIIDNES